MTALRIVLSVAVVGHATSDLGEPMRRAAGGLMTEMSGPSGSNTEA